MKKALLVIGVIVAVLVIGVVLFLNLAPGETKRSVFESIGIENTGLAADLALETFIQATETGNRENLFGKQVLELWLINTHRTRIVSGVTIRIEFADGSTEMETIDKTLNPGGLGKPVKFKFSKRSGIVGWDVIKAW